MRPATSPVEGIAFSRLFFDLAAAPGAAADHTLSAIYERVTAMPEALATTQSFTLVRGRTEIELAPPAPPPAELTAQIDRAAEAKDWASVVARRRERLATIASSRQRAKELVSIARILQQDMHDSSGALDALEQARDARATSRVGPAELSCAASR